MADAFDSLTHLPGTVQDYFMVENNVAATRLMSVFKALDKFKRQSVGLMVSRVPIATDSIPLFAENAARLSQLVDISSYGVDAHGIAFLVLPVLDGKLLGEGTEDFIELERRYLAAVRLVAAFHASNVVCGDLCSGAFLLERSGLLRIFGGWSAVLNESSEGGSGSGETLDWECCRAPEQRKGGPATKASDVFALAMIGYQMFTGQHPQFDDKGNVIAHVLVLEPSAPEWIDDVFSAALDPSPASRLQTAGDLVKAIVDWRERTAARDSLPSKIEAPPPPPLRTSVGAVPIELRVLPGSAIEREPAPEPRNLRKGEVIKGALTIALLLLGLWMGFSGTSWFEGAETKTALDVQPGDISAAVIDSSASGDKAKYIDELATSGDPLAHDILIRMFKEAETEEIAAKVWDSVLMRARGNGLAQSSDHVRAWSQTQTIAARRGPLGEMSLRLLDPALPVGVRMELLEGTKAFDSQFAVGLAAALALDLKQVESFRPIFSTAAATAFGVDPSTLQDHSIGALMLATPEISNLFAEQIVDQRSLVSDSDVLWLLPELTKRQLPGIKRLADQVIARKLIPEVSRLFLEVLSRKSSIPARVQISLVTCALDQASKSDVVSFAGWYDSDAEKSLWALILTAEDKDVGARGYDALAAKPLLAPGISELYDFVRSEYHGDRAVVGRVVAALALENVLSDEVFAAAIDGLDRLPKGKDLVKVVLKGPSARAVKEVIKRYNSLIERTQLLDLLKKPDPLVRSVAIEALSSSNDVGVLKILADSYAEEIDPTVRAVYERSVSTIKERVKE